jgi:uncharacterized membrane protein YozB (DUF420 family)
VYRIVLFLHSWLRWFVVVLGALAVVRSLLGLVRKQPWTDLDNRIGRLLAVCVDAQLLVGLVLYVFLSPVTRRALSDFGGAMSDGALRFWALEHVLMMVVAAVLVHIGRVAIRNAESDRSKHRRALVWYGVALLLILAAIPWPMTANGRPWFNLLGM